MALIDVPDMLGSGPALEEREDDAFAGYEDYFGFDSEEKFYLPDGKQWISFRPMNEGERRKYEARTSRDVKFNRRTDDAAIKINAGEDRYELLMSSVVNWNLVRKSGSQWVQVPFSKGSENSALGQWLKVANPRLVNDLYAAIVRANPWLSADQTSEMIREEIQRLEALLEEKLRQEAAQKNS